jgi:hypothetical protein
MPRKPRKLRNLRTGLTTDQLNDLVFGFSLTADPFGSEEARREAYFKHERYLCSLSGQGQIDGLYGELKKGVKPSAYWSYRSAISLRAACEAHGAGKDRKTQGKPAANHFPRAI